MLSCSISYPDLIKFPYFRDATEREVREWNEAQTEGEDRVTLGASLMCKVSSQFCLFVCFFVLVASFSFQSAQMLEKKIAHSLGQIMQSSQIFHVFHSPRAWVTGLAMGPQNMEELLGLPLIYPYTLTLQQHSHTPSDKRTLTLKKDYVKESSRALLVCVERVFAHSKFFLPPQERVVPYVSKRFVNLMPYMEGASYPLKWITAICLQKKSSTGCSQGPQRGLFWVFGSHAWLPTLQVTHIPRTAPSSDLCPYLTQEKTNNKNYNL